MTRFARAKGSKASNERLPNEATPWHVMKQQLEENSAKRKGPVEKTKSAKELLAAKQDVSAENAQNSWAVFENISEKKTNKDKKKEKSQPNKAVKKQKTRPKKIEKKEKPQAHEDKKNQVDCSSDKPENNIKTKKKSGKRNINEVENPAADVTNKKLKTDENQPDKKPKEQDNKKTNAIEAKTDKVNKKRKRNKQNTSQPNENQNKTLDNTNESQHDKDTLSKRQKRNMRRRKNPNESLPNATQNNNNVQNNTVSNKNERKDNNRPTNRFDRNSAPKSKGVNNMPKRFGPKQFEAEKKRKPAKIRDDKEHKRRKPDIGSLKMMINGIEVEVVKFDGFPVKKEDADRLRDLNKKMIMKGIPKKEIDAAMKLERRKAEKALARIRKCVCFHCRKAGHNLSDCPELGAEQAGTGICFKCGSTEHTHFECKVSKPAEFRYATCFICREQGHIAKQCPDNPKGIYPQGGGCNVCGDVTHLKKDCPDLIKEKEESTVTLSTITNGNLESLEGNENGKIEKDAKNIKKVVKF